MDVSKCRDIACRSRSKYWAVGRGHFRVVMASVIISLPLLGTPCQADWTELGSSDMYRIVLVDPTDIQNTKIYWDAIRRICGARHCNLVFVRDKNFAPRGGERFTSTQFKEALLIYNTDKGFSWNCDLRPEADNCFEK